MVSDGEAEALALAASRAYLLATDDRKARRLAAEQVPPTRLTGTLEVIQEWQRTAGPTEAEVASALRLILERATYRPRKTDPLYGWWAALTLPS